MPGSRFIVSVCRKPGLGPYEGDVGSLDETSDPERTPLVTDRKVSGKAWARTGDQKSGEQVLITIHQNAVAGVLLLFTRDSHLPQLHLL